MRHIILLLTLTLSSLSTAAKPTLLTFRAGDRVPVTLLAGGDLFESEAETPVYVVIKKTFHLKLVQGGPLVSFDGVTFQPYRDVLESQSRVEANGSNPVAITVSIDAKLK